VRLPLTSRPLDREDALVTPPGQLSAPAAIPGRATPEYSSPGRRLCLSYKSKAQAGRNAAPGVSIPCEGALAQSQSRHT